MFEIVANLHMHTPFSDGEKYHREIAADAAKAGLNAIIVTDHNVFAREVDGYMDGVLVLAGEEVHDATRQPQASHCLVYGACDEMAAFAPNPQKLVSEVARRRGLSFFAHPFEKASPISPDFMAINWEDWDTRGNTGLELWNAMTEVKARSSNYLAGFLCAFFPSFFLRGPFKETLAKWDALLAEGRRVVAIGNADAHGTPYHLGPIHREVLPYRYLFRCVNTHVLLERPFGKNAQRDAQLLYDALRAGHCFVGYDRPHTTRGFSFTAKSGADVAVMGDELRRKAATLFEVRSPGLGHIRLIKDGRVVAAKFGLNLDYLSIEPGVYRVEVRRFFRGWLRGWIYSNPIYVR